MAVFTPLQADVAMRQDQCDLDEINWNPSTACALSAFSSRVVSIGVLDRVLGFQVLKEMIYGIHGETFEGGATPSGFAHSVKGALSFRCPLSQNIGQRGMARLSIIRFCRL